ncbi:hypothetical protein C7M84_000575 [Penaeus vannamei]|uniref:Uncharacterized protein n=1 Tax=Penaeus vannamei TaxID=6689 RepID=A0A3R7N985_PENVA|nr:hypothetical protein C7M84_000575 [Penaeus vannamei]
MLHLGERVATFASRARGRVGRHVPLSCKGNGGSPRSLSCKGNGSPHCLSCKGKRGRPHCLSCRGNGSPRSPLVQGERVATFPLVQGERVGRHVRLLCKGNGVGLIASRWRSFDRPSEFLRSFPFRLFNARYSGCIARFFRLGAPLAAGVRSRLSTGDSFHVTHFSERMSLLLSPTPISSSNFVSFYVTHFSENVTPSLSHSSPFFQLRTHFTSLISLSILLSPTPLPSSNFALTQLSEGVALTHSLSPNFISNSGNSHSHSHHIMKLSLSLTLCLQALTLLSEGVTLTHSLSLALTQPSPLQLAIRTSASRRPPNTLTLTHSRTSSSTGSTSGPVALPPTPASPSFLSLGDLSLFLAYLAWFLLSRLYSFVFFLLFLVFVSFFPRLSSPFPSSSSPIPFNIIYFVSLIRRLSLFSSLPSYFPILSLPLISLPSFLLLPSPISHPLFLSCIIISPFLSLFCTSLRSLPFYSSYSSCLSFLPSHLPYRSFSPFYFNPSHFSLSPHSLISSPSLIPYYFFIPVFTLSHNHNAT